MVQMEEVVDTKLIGCDRKGHAMLMMVSHNVLV
jgi:hypothetical protein